MKSNFGRKSVLILAAMICLAAGWISYALTVKHLRLPIPQQGLLDRACTAFETASCEEVLQSKWSKIEFVVGKSKASVPTSQLGLAYFTFMLCWLVVIGQVSPKRWEVHLLGTSLTAIGLGSCIFLAVVMYTSLPKWCPLCASTHLASLLLFICMLLLWPRQTTAASPAPSPAMPAPAIPSLFDTPTESVAAASDTAATTPAMSPPSTDQAAMAMGPAVAAIPLPPRPWPSGQAVVVTVALAFLLILSQHLFLLNLETTYKLKGSEVTSKYWQKKFKEYDDHWEHTAMAWQIIPQVSIKLENEPARGPANAPHTMVVFGDFQCPACAKFETEYLPKLRPLAEKYGDFKLVFKHWPICPECNPYAKYNNHPKACLAAKAAEAARILGGNEGFWKMHDLLFSRQADIKAADTRWFLERARESGFDTAAFLKAMESKEAGDRIAAHTQEGEILGQGIVADERLEEVKVESTPAIYIDGKKVRSVQHNRTWRMIFASRPTAVPKSSSTSRPAATGTTPGYGVLAPDQIDDGDHR